MSLFPRRGRRVFFRASRTVPSFKNGLAAILPLLAVSLCLGGCGDGGTTGALPGGTTGGGPGPFPRSVTANWTVLVYMNAANNLEPFSVENMDQMEQAPYSSKVNIVVEWKRFHGSNPTSDDALFDSAAPEFDGTRRFWLSGRGKSGFMADEIQDLGSGAVGSNPTTPDLGNWQTLHQFILWGEQNFPANHYLVVLWDHGAGWEHRALLRSIPHRGISYDDQSGNSIETWQLPEALAGQAPLDVVAMDASLMQMAEVTYEMRNVTSYVVGSEDSPPGDGYPYQLWMPPLTENPAMDPVTLSKLIVDTHVSYYQTTADSSGRFDPVTQSAVQTSALPALAQSATALAAVLTADSSQYGAQFAKARDSADVYANDGFCSGGSCYAEFKDLVQYADLLEKYAGAAPGLTTAAERVKTAVGQAVIDNKASGSDLKDAAGTPFSHGLSIYVPLPASKASATVGPPQTYDSTYYPNLAWARDTSWPLWIQTQPE